MKTRSLVFKAMLLLGFSPLYFMKLHAQQKTATEKNVMHLKMVQEKNGQRFVIDTIIENNPNFDVDAYLESKGFDKPSKPGRKVIMHCDSNYKGALMRNEIGPVFFKLDPPMPPHPSVPGQHPVPPPPPELPGDVLKMIEHLKLGSSGTGDTIIIISGDSSMYISPEDLHLTEFDKRSLGGIITNSKQVEIYVFRHVDICKLDAAEMKAMKAPKEQNELHIEQLNLFPNPNNGLFKLQFELSGKGTTTISVAEKNGNEVYSEKLKDFTGRYEKEIDLSSHPKGMYYLTVKQGKQSLVRKLVID